MNTQQLWLRVVAIWTVLVGVSLATHSLLPIDETRYVTVAWNMWQRGDLLVPWLNDAPYSHKPPLLFWIIHAGWWLTGINEWWPRVAPGLTGLLATVLTYRIAGHLWPEDTRARRLAPLVLVGCLWWALFAAATMFDMLVACATVLGITGLLRAANGQTQRGFALTGVAIGLGLLAKGPTILLQLLPAALLAPWWVAARPTCGWRKWYLGVLGAVALGTAIVLTWAVPAAQQGGPHYADMIFWGQTAHRMVDSFAHRAPIWWYLALAPFILFPWLMWPPTWTALRGLRIGSDHGVRLCIAWALPVFIGFSLISGKQAHYLLPLMPAFALVLARALSQAAPQLSAWHQSGPALAGLVLAGGIALAAPLAPRLGGADWLADSPPLGGLALGIWGVGLIALRRPDLEAIVGRLAGLSLLAVLTADLAVIAAAGEAYDLRPISQHLKRLEEREVAVAHVGKYHGQFQFIGRLEHSPTVLGEDLVDAWYRACNLKWTIDDSPSTEPNHAEFVEHRHDQSVFSLRDGVGSARLAHASGEQSLKRLTGIGGAHEGLAHQKGMHTRRAHLRDISRGGNATLGDQQTIIGHPRQLPERGLKVDSEGAQVAVVDANQWGAQAQGPHFSWSQVR